MAPMRQNTLIVVMLLAGGCAWTPVVHEYPSGLRIVRGDSTLVSQACSNGIEIPHRGGVKRIVYDDKWRKIDPRRIVGCYQKHDDTIYIRNTKEGACALLHELAHREGVTDPSAEGFDWGACR